MLLNLQQISERNYKLNFKESIRLKQNMMSYKIYRLKNSDIQQSEVIALDAQELKTRVITLQESFFLKSYLIYSELDYSKDILLYDFILVELDNDIATAKSQCKSIRFKNREYEYFMSSVSWMKHEDRDTNSKCCALFISKEISEFKEVYEDLISLGKIREFEGQARCINKEQARISLGLSSAFDTGLIPNVIILPECKYQITSNIITIENNEVVQKYSEEVTVTQFDGSGLMSKEFANRIRQARNLDYDVTYAIIRMYGTATKGLCVSIDFNGYIQEHYEKDTEYLKKYQDKYYLKDVYGNWVCINDADMILNASQVKWAGNFKDATEIKNLINSPEYKKYKELLTNLWVTKVNKKDDEINKYTTSNYQLLGNLALTKNEMKILSDTTEQIYHRILDGDADYIHIFLDDIVKSPDKDDLDDSKEMNEYTQAHVLINMNPDFIKSAYVKRSVSKMVKKKSKNICGGKFYIKGDYKVMIQDPISYLDWMLNRTDESNFINDTNGLKADKFYCSGVEEDEVRTISRNPLNSFSEILNVSFTKNDSFTKYLSHLSRDIIVFNCFDLTKEILSGADFDGDMTFVVSDEIIRNSVVKELPFVNLDDVNNKPVKWIWNDENRLQATLEASGDTIGSLANKGAGVSNLATVAGYRNFKNRSTGEISSYDDMWEKFKESKKHYPDLIDKDLLYSNGELVYMAK
jgi:hypothetical protein